ncbi:MAG: polysaccharide biosynthesis tyrosine autokinase [Fuerstiella sp.]|nr:polysaccharide biosynthesis tyrosine autokinase [Fuerstiella sp.]
MSDSSVEQCAPQGDQFEIDLIGILRRRKGLIALGLFLGVGIASLYFAVTPPTYRSEMEILVLQRSGSLAKGAASNGEVEGTQTEEDVLSTHIQLFTSRRILAAAIESANLTELASFQEVIRNNGSPIVFIQSHLAVSKGGKGVAKDAHTLKATYESSSPVDCATVLRAVFDQYAAYLKEHFQGTGTEAVRLLTKLATENSEAVRAADKELSEFMSSTDLLWDGDTTQNIHKDRLRRIEEDLSRLEEKQNATVSRLAVIQEYMEQNEDKGVSDLSRLALLSEAEVGRLKLLFDVTKGDSGSEAFQAEQPVRRESARAEYDKYLELVMREKKLTEKFNDGHPSVVSVREQLEVLRAFIDRNSAKIKGTLDLDRMDPEEMLATYVGLLQHDVAEGVKQREQLLSRSRQELKAAKILEAAEIKVDSLRSELSRCHSVYEETQATLKELNFVRDYAGYSTDVIGNAEPQDKRVWPRLRILLALGLFAGGGFGFLMAMVADFTDTTFSDPDDVGRVFGAPVLGHVPQFPYVKESNSKGLLPMHPTVYAFHRPRSKEAEVFRIIRTSVMCAVKASGARVLQVTSPQPGDGNSTTAVNLAVSFAQSGRRVLLIDADLRQPRAATLCRETPVPGLSEVLLGDVEPRDVVRETAQKNLFVVVSGKCPGSPAELLGSVELKNVLHVYAEQYDFVIVDTPPILAVSDAVVVVDAVDAVIMTLRITKHGRKAAVHTKQLLDEHNTSVVGLVVNGVGLNRNHYGYKKRPGGDGYAYSTARKYADYYVDSEDDSPGVAEESEFDDAV